MAVTKLTSLSIFFPCYNEAKNIESLVSEFDKAAKSVAKHYEIIIINDGSSDNTKQTVAKLRKVYPKLRIISHSKNKGYGASLRTGFSAAKYDWTFFTDGDGQFSAAELPNFVAQKETSDVIIGYRKTRADGAHRERNAKIFKTFIDLLFRLRVKDIDCAYKLIKTQAVHDLHLEASGAMISAELLYKLKKQKHRFKQLPVNHYERRHGTPTGNHPRVIIKAGYEFLMLYLKMKLLGR